MNATRLYVYYILGILFGILFIEGYTNFGSLMLPKWSDEIIYVSSPYPLYLILSLAFLIIGNYFERRHRGAK